MICKNEPYVCVGERLFSWIKVIVVVLLQPWWSKDVSKASFLERQCLLLAQLYELESPGRVPNTQALVQVYTGTRSTQVKHSEVPVENSEVQPSALLPSSPSTKSASIYAEIPENGQIPAPFKHCIRAHNINIWIAITAVRRRVCSHFPSPTPQLTAQHLSCSDGLWLRHSFLSTLLIQEDDYLDSSTSERNNLLLCSSLYHISPPLAAAYTTEKKIYSYFNFLHAYRREALLRLWFNKHQLGPGPG